MAANNDHNGGLLRGIEAITTKLENLTTRVEHTEALLHELRLNQKSYAEAWSFPYVSQLRPQPSYQPYVNHGYLYGLNQYSSGRPQSGLALDPKC